MTKFFDRVHDTTTTTGTGALTMSGTPPTGKRAFVSSSTFSNGDEVEYTVESADKSEWEIGRGVLSATQVLTRTTVYASSNAGSLVNFSAGTKTVFGTIPANFVKQAPSRGLLVAWQSIRP